MKCKWKDCENEVSGKAQYCSGGCRVKQSRSVTRKQLPDGAGYLYLIHCAGTTYYKIGITAAEPIVRLQGLQVGCPLKLELEWAIQIPDVCREEVGIHEALADVCVRGEWFNLTDGDVDCIKTSYLAVYEAAADVRQAQEATA